jgi:DNA-binding MarR family transcriptional regulator
MKKGAENVVQASRPVADEDLLLQLDQQLCFALYSASLQLTKLYKPYLDRLGLTYPQYLVMMVLWEHDAQPVTGLGERLGLDSGTLTPLLKRLESKGWLTRERDTVDERRLRVRLTPAGGALREQARAVPPAMRCLLGGRDEDLATLRTSLQALRVSMSQV